MVAGTGSHIENLFGYLTVVLSHEYAGRHVTKMENFENSKRRTAAISEIVSLYLHISATNGRTSGDSKERACA